MFKEFFPTGSYKNEEILSALKWYFESKNYSLDKALEIRSPLSVEKQKELRINYSNYFTSLMSGIEVLLESSYRNNKEFRGELYEAFSFDGKQGEDSYNYLRELRNSIVHRGYDISSASSFRDDIPILIAPSEIPNKNGTVIYNAFGQTIIDIIEKVESVVGTLIYSHVQENSLTKPTYSKIEQKEMIMAIIPKIPHMPEWAKSMAATAFEDMDFDEMESPLFSSLREALEYNPLSKIQTRDATL